MDPRLYKAATQGDVEMLRRLVVDPEDPSILRSTTPQHNTALHLAALHGHATFAGEVLGKNEDALDKKSPLIMTNKAGNTALHEAVRSRRATVAVALLDADPVRGHDLNERMESPLHMAAREGLDQVVRKIVDYTLVDPELFPSLSLTVSGTALHQAVLGTHYGIMEILLEKRPELIELTDSDGNNALHYAAHKDHRRAAEMLLKARTDLAYKRNHQGMSPLHVAARYGSTDAIKALLRHCPDVAEMADGSGRNAFHVSADSSKAKALRCLLRHVRPAELPNRVDTNGDAPLHIAAKRSYVQCALVLLKDPRVDPCVRNHGGDRPRSLIEMKIDTGETDTNEIYLWKQLVEQESKRCRKQQLPSMQGRRRGLNNSDFDKVVESYFLAATLIATVTFAATFTMPGGYDQIKGVALHGQSKAFKIFVVSNTVAMCTSIVVIFLLIWARQEPVTFRLRNLAWSQQLTVIACLAMLLSLITAVYVTVAPIAPWPAYAVIAIAIGSPALFFYVYWTGTTWA
nr:unnamed protein product [Digitaria exilis]